MAGALDARWRAVDTYFEEVLIGDDFPGVISTGLPPHQVSPAQGKLLHLLSLGARSILEIGTLGGYSTLWLARSKPERLVTLELNPAHAAVAARNLAGHAVDLRVGPALETLPLLSGPFDFIFIDADKPNNPEYFRHALRLSRVGTLIVVDAPPPFRPSGARATTASP